MNDGTGDIDRLPTTPREHLRRELRARRAALTAVEQERRAHATARIGVAHLNLDSVGVVASYQPFGGELDPGPLVAVLAPQMVVLPVIAGDRLEFAPASGPMAPNRYGIAEPTGPAVDLNTIDVVIVPAVAVDRRGTRLGMGAGYYDRTFAHLVARQRPSSPLLVALVHDEQVVDELPSQPWDVAMDAIVTPTKFVDCARLGE